MILKIENFRNISSAQLEFGVINYIYGKNASGKTSILESIYLLNFIKSFRQMRNIDEVILNGAPFFYLQMDTGNQAIAVEKKREQPIKMKINNNFIKAKELIKQSIPTKVISPHVDFFLNIESSYRRNFFDWLVIHMKHDFYSSLAKYEIALENRNAGLKNGKIDDDDFWIEQLAFWGEKISKLRDEVFFIWLDKVNILLSETSLDKKISFRLYKGWSYDINLLSSLKHNQERDIQKGYTDIGPHRCDLEVKVNNLKAVSVLSRGQLKLLNLSMAIAQTSILNYRDTILLIDDLVAELDSDALYFFNKWLAKYKNFLFISIINKEIINSIALPDTDNKFFHIKEGNIYQEVF